MAARTCIARTACRFSAKPIVPRSAAFQAPKPQIAATSFRGGYGGIRQFSASSALHEKKYTQEHEWIELSEDGKQGTVGISEYAAGALGDAVYVELPELGLEVGAADALGAVESVKSASEILSPVAGKVIETNGALESKPVQINESPEGDGWIAKLEVNESVKEELGNLMDAAAYKQYTEEVKPE